MNTIDISSAKRILANLRAVHVTDARRPRGTYEPQPLLADLALLDLDQLDALAQGDYWAAVSGVFVEHEGTVRLVSLAEAGRWAA